MVNAPCLLWDVDGTLTDSTGLIVDALGHVYAQFFQRSMPAEERRALIGTPLRKQIRVFGEPETFGLGEETIIREFIAFYERHGDREVILRPVINVLIEGKRRGIPTGLVTSKNREELTNTLPRLDIAEWIDIAITADDVAQPKPAPEGLLLALSRLGVSEEDAPRSIYVGDTIYDMRAARSAGIERVAVTWGATRRELLELEDPTYLVNTADELRALFF